MYKISFVKVLQVAVDTAHFCYKLGTSFGVFLEVGFCVESSTSASDIRESNRVTDLIPCQIRPG